VRSLVRRIDTERYQEPGAEPQQREKSTNNERFMHGLGASSNRYSWKNEVKVNDPLPQATKPLRTQQRGEQEKCIPRKHTIDPALQVPLSKGSKLQAAEASRSTCHGSKRG
jgi:hypothetical protein